MNIFKRFYALLEDAPDTILSLNFGSTQLRMGLFEREGDQWVLKQVQREPMPKPFSAAPLAEPIRKFFQVSASARNAGVVATWKADFLEKPVVLPDMPPAEVRAAVKFAMEHHFSVQLDICLYDWISSAEIMPAHGMRANQYFVYAVPKKEAQPYVDLITSLGGTPYSITPTSAAYAQLLASDPTDARDVGILDIDTDSSTFQIFRKGKPLLSRTLAVGSKVFADAAAAQKGGHARPRQPDAAAGGVPQDPFEQSELPEEVVQRLRPQIERLQNQLQSSIDFYHQQNFGGDLGKIYLCESGIKLNDLDRFLEYGAEIPVKRPALDDLKTLRYDSPVEQELRSDLNDFVPMIGAFQVWLAKGMNLMPREILFNLQTKTRSKILRLAAIVIGMALILVNLYFGLSLTLKKQELRGLKSQAMLASEFEEIYQKSEAVRRFRAEVAKGDLPPLALMKLLSAEMPEGSVITDIAYDKPKRRFELVGKVFAKSQDAVGISARVVASLASSPFFYKVELTEGVRDQKTGEYRFKIAGITHEL